MPTEDPKTTPLHGLDKTTRWLTLQFNRAAGAAIVAMMLLTCADVFLRMFRQPITGAYELVGLFGAVFAAFSLGYTAMEKGHIAVDFLVAKLPRKYRDIVDGINALAGAVMFGCIAKAAWGYGQDMKTYGEVSMTLQVPLYPFIYGISIGCALLTLVLGLQALQCTPWFRSSEGREFKGA